MNDRLKNPQTAALYRAELLKEQDGIDPITKEIVKDAVLDHQHFGEQLCRAVLERTSNSFEGKVYNAYRRYIKHLTDTPLPEILRNLADYLEADVSTNKIHHTAIAIDCKKFKALNASTQKRLLTECGEEPLENGSKRVKQARNLIKNGALQCINKEWNVRKWA